MIGCIKIPKVVGDNNARVRVCVAGHFSRWEVPDLFIILVNPWVLQTAVGC